MSIPVEAVLRQIIRSTSSCLFSDAHNQACLAFRKVTLYRFQPTALLLDIFNTVNLGIRNSVMVSVEIFGRTFSIDEVFAEIIE